MSVASLPLQREARARSLTASFRDRYPFEPRFLELASGHSLHYVDEGPRDAPALLLLHGNPTWSFLWRELILRLSGHLRVVAPDHLGCGLSDKPQDYAYALEQHIENLEELVEHLGLGSMSLGLHDWGGAIGMGFARRHPARIERLFAANTAAFRSDAMPRRIAVCRLPVFGPAAVRGLGAFVRGLVTMGVELPLLPAVRRGYLAPYADYKSRVANLAFVHDIPMGPEHPSYAELCAIEEALPTFADHPSALLWGERDWCFTPAFRDRWLEFWPRAESVAFPRAGHLVFEDAGPPAVEFVADFLARHPVSATEPGERDSRVAAPPVS